MPCLDLFQLHPSANTANACRHFIATTGDMVGASRLDNGFLGGGNGRRNKVEVEGLGEIIQV